MSAKAEKPAWTRWQEDLEVVKQFSGERSTNGAGTFGHHKQKK